MSLNFRPVRAIVGKDRQTAFVREGGRLESPMIIRKGWVMAKFSNSPKSKEDVWYWSWNRNLGGSAQSTLHWL